MHVFYLHLPWLIDQEDYNCSSKTWHEWKSQGSINTLEGWYFAVMGTIISIFYSLCLYGMYRGSLLRVPCYRLMFFNGIMSITDILVTSFFVAYFSFTGSVFCTAILLEWVSGHVAYSFWLGASFNCVVLAFNRFVEMIPPAKFLQFLFRGKTLYMWMMLSTLYMLMACFALRPLPFNSAISAFIATPMIRGYDWEYEHFTSVYLLIHNCIILAVLIPAYSTLCCYLCIKRAGKENLRVHR